MIEQRKINVKVGETSGNVTELFIGKRTPKGYVSNDSVHSKKWNEYKVSTKMSLPWLHLQFIWNFIKDIDAKIKAICVCMWEYPIWTGK